MSSLSKDKNVTLEVFKSSGPGGQHKNKRFTAVRLRHHPTGIVVVAQKRRSLEANKTLAMERLTDKLAELRRPHKPRVPTKKTRGSRAKALDWKKRHGRKKQLRRPMVLRSQED